MKKRLFFFAVLLLAALSVAAQSTRIAILETVDHEGKVPYGVKLMLRTNLTHAISSTEGFEGYDQIDLDALLGVKDFASNGVVTDAQVKQLGEKTGSAYLLIAEVAQYDATQIIVTAKILNAETGAIEATAPPKVTATDPESLQQAGAELMGSLLATEEPAAPPLSNAWRTLLAKALTNVTQRMDDGGIHIGETEVPSYIIQVYADGSLFCGDLVTDTNSLSYGMLVSPEGYELSDCPGGWAYCGGFLNGEKSGQGLVFDDGGRLLYHGEFAGNKPVGVYPQSDAEEEGWAFVVSEIGGGDYYVGQAAGGVHQGFGLYLWANGDAWFGMWEEGKMEGEGIYKFFDGRHTGGYWEEGEFVMTLNERYKRYLFGKRLAAVMTHAPIQYTDGGAHFGDTLNGLCVHSYGKNEQLYLGEIVDGIREATGGLYIVMVDDHIVNLPKSWVYSGAFKNGLPHDTLGCVYDRRGKVIYAGGIQGGIPLGRYPGDYPALANILFSVMELEGGAMYMGETINGLSDGIGIYVWPDDDAWLGYWDEGLRNGPGLQMNSDGSYVFGIWDKGEFEMNYDDYIRKQKEAIPWTDRLAEVTAKLPANPVDGGVHVGDIATGYCFHTWGLNNRSLYFGQMKDGSQEGYGLQMMVDEDYQIANCPEGRVYVGEWKKGLQHDKRASVYDWEGKLVYSGRFRKGKPTQAYPMVQYSPAYSFQIFNIDGDKYIGEVYDGNVKSGYGIYIWESGDAWFGSWHNDKPVHGLYLKSTGEYYIGNWDDIP